MTSSKLHFLSSTVGKSRASERQSDAELWASFRSGSEEAYQRIYDTHFDVLYNYGRQFCLSPALVKDCIQDVFVTLWVSRASLGSTDCIKYYLFKALKRRVVKCLKKEQRRVELRAQIPPFENVVSAEQHIISSQEDEEQKNRVRRAVNQLSDKQREAVFLFFYEGLSYPQIAKLLSVQPKTARNLVGKALQAMRSHLQVLVILLSLLLSIR